MGDRGREEKMSDYSRIPEVAVDKAAGMDRSVMLCPVCTDSFTVPRDKTAMHRAVKLRKHLAQHVKDGQLKDSVRAQITKELNI